MLGDRVELGGSCLVAERVCRRSRDQHPREEVSSLAGTQPAQPKGLPALGAWGQLDRDLSRRALELDGSSANGLSQAHGNLDVQIVALATVDGVLKDRDSDQQVARRSAARARLPQPCEAQGLALADALGDLDLDRLVQANRGRPPANREREVDLELHLLIAASLRSPLAATTTAKQAPEELVETAAPLVKALAPGAEVKGALAAKLTHSLRRSGVEASLECDVPKLVVELALVGVREDPIGRADLAKLLLARRIDVRVELSRQLLEALADLVSGSTASDAKNGVEVLAGHDLAIS